jgi:membrane fusion protein (multidrug efflux system)
MVNYNTKENAMTRRLLPSFILLAALVPSLSGCGSDAQSKPAAEAKADDKPKVEAVTVETGAVTQGDITATYAGTATLEAEHEARLVAELGGVVLNLAVEEGQSVKKGQVLARVDGDRAALQLRQAEVALQRIAHNDARNESLYAKQLIARNAYEQNKSDLATSRAEVEMARLTLSKSSIVAPFDGVVTRRWVKLGQLLKATEPVFDIADFTALKAKLRVPERASVALRPGQSVEFSADALPHRRFDAKVERVAPMVDAASGTVEIVIAVNNSDASLRPGLFSRLTVAYDNVAAATLAPKAAVMSDASGSSVFTVQDGKAHRVPVTLGYESGKNVQVLAGLSVGNEVIVAGQSALTEGTRVEAVKPVAAVAVAATP